MSHTATTYRRTHPDALRAVLVEHRTTADLLRRMVADTFPAGRMVRLPQKHGGIPGVVAGYLSVAPDVVRVMVERAGMDGSGSVDYPVDVLAVELLDANLE